MRMELINNPAVNIQTVEVVRITGYRFKLRACPLLVNIQLIAAK